MKRNFGTLTLLVAILMAATLIGCERTTQQTIPMMPVADDEESAVRLAITDTYDNVRNGAHLIISYDAVTDAFTGTVTNTTNAILTQVRVEVHLYDGMVTVDELGPTPDVDLMSGESHAITLPVMSQSFTEWVAHPEVGPRSAGGGEGGAESGAEGGAEGGGEHGGQGGEGAEGGGN
ncbi:MAG: FxLYD domain-containing protein [Candidatus Poribacteria bacterium]|nr:FxLYD domain-containing protein [Candidatus Poribacteria bacterium]